MKRFGVLVAVAILALNVCCPARAQRACAMYSVRVYFPWDNAQLTDSYLDNSGAFAALDSLIASAPAFSDSLHLEIRSFASPEGKDAYNRNLATRRAQALADYLVRNWPGVESMIRVFPGQVAWEDFRSQVLADTLLPESDRARLIGVVDADILPNRKAWLLRNDPAYATVSRHFKRERYAELTWTINGEPVPAQAPEPVDLEEESNEIEATEPIETIETDETIEPLEQSESPKYILKPLLSVGTNLLLDGGVFVNPIYFTPNVEVEVPIGKRWSVWGEMTFPWWVNRQNSRAWQILKWDLGARWYFSRLNDEDPFDVLRGHHLGLDLSAGYYDIEPEHTGYQGEFQLVGLEYGYTFRFGRFVRLDLSVGAGWMGSHYRFYAGDATDAHLLYQNDGKLQWFGPTRAGVSVKIIIPYRTKVKTE